MNLRIKELARLAITDKLTLDEFINDLKLNPNKYWGFTDAELEKFVKLIVAEYCSHKNHTEEELETSWTKNPDRMGGCFTQHEIDEAGLWK